LQGSGGFNRADITRIRRIIHENQPTLMEAWNEYFNG
jgi:hypothetical protein